MNITDIKFRKLFPSGKLKAIVSVTFDDMFVVHDIKVIEGQHGYFVAMPNRKTKTGEYKDICHPINSEARGQLETTVLDEYIKNALPGGEVEVSETEDLPLGPDSNGE